MFSPHQSHYITMSVELSSPTGVTHHHHGDSISKRKTRELVLWIFLFGANIPPDATPNIWRAKVSVHGNFRC